MRPLESGCIRDSRTHDSASQLEAGPASQNDPNVDEKHSPSRLDTQSSVAALLRSGHGCGARACSHVQGSLATWTNSCFAKHKSRSLIHKGRKSRINVRKLERFPLGFPKAAAFLNSDDEFMIYRRFGFLFSRLLLHKQDELAALEDLLCSMDAFDDSNDQTKRYLRDRFADEARQEAPWPQSRKQVLEEIERKVLEYSQLLLRAQQLTALNRPSASDHNSVMSFMENKPAPMNERERAFVYEKDDLITLRPGRENAWLDVLVERLLKKCRWRILKYIFCSDETERKTDDTDIHYFTRSRITSFVTLIITLIILILLLIPIWLLYHLTETKGLSTASGVGIGAVLCVFTLLFSAMVAVFTNARRHEIFAASAGYCAVLVVFVGNVGN